MVTPPQRKCVGGECASRLAETKDHMNWELIGHVVKEGKGDETSFLKTAHDEVEEEMKMHTLVSHARLDTELWITALGLPAVLPPPEEVKDVDTAIGAARAEKSRDEMLKVRRPIVKH